MRNIAGFSFPSQGDITECREWKPIVRMRALHTQVLVVARTRIEGTWKAYIAPVPGYDHLKERDAVLRNGSPVDKELACYLFPEFKGIPYAY